jgi:hypothetical protein
MQKEKNWIEFCQILPEWPPSLDGEQIPVDHPCAPATLEGATGEWRHPPFRDAGTRSTRSRRKELVLAEKYNYPNCTQKRPSTHQFSSSVLFLLCVEDTRLLTSGRLRYHADPNREQGECCVEGPASGLEMLWQKRMWGGSSQAACSERQSGKHAGDPRSPATSSRSVSNDKRASIQLRIAQGARRAPWWGGAGSVLADVDPEQWPCVSFQHLNISHKRLSSRQILGL